MERILIVEDDNSYRSFIKEHIIGAGYEVDDADNPITGIECLARKEYDLVISDLKMPEMSGVRFTKTAKAMQMGIKTIILTADPDDESEISSIDNQVDLYIVKEKGMGVLLKYIRSVLDREVSYDSEEIIRSKVNKIEVHKSTHQVFKNGEVVELTRREYEILELLLENKNQILSREEIVEKIWMLPVTEIEPRVVDVHIKNLRDKLRIFSILTVRGFGYKWNE
ncbi:MAG: response regulator transcription factor [Coprobacillaceae bacterium]